MKETIRKAVREDYAKVAKGIGSCCGVSKKTKSLSKSIGYTEEEINSVPNGANLSLGCGNPGALLSLKEGDIVLDLGSGAGFDCFLASKKVGNSGKVIGVDMTPEMIDKARENARKNNYENVEFRLGEIENLPAADNSVDVVISNCVINLSIDKQKVFKEAFRILKTGGRLMVSDIVLLKELPETIKNSINAYVGCLAGAMMKDSYLKAISNAGFHDVKIMDETSVDSIINDSDAKAKIQELNIPQEIIKEIANSTVSTRVQGIK